MFTRFFKKGSGEYITFMVSIVIIIALLIIILGVIQLNACKASLNNALTAASRSAAICASLDDANDKVQVVADSSITTPNIKNLRAWVTMTDETPEWGSGSYAVVHVSGDVKTLSGIASGTVEKKALVAVELITNGIGTLNGEAIDIPIGLGNEHSFMGWHKITQAGTAQMRLKREFGEHYDDEGFAKINDRYVIACTDTYGNVGDYIDFYKKDGLVIPCVIGDIKNQNDAGCTKWGHNGGKCVIEFIVNESQYRSAHRLFGGAANPGERNCHPEWNQYTVRAVRGGSVFG